MKRAFTIFISFLFLLTFFSIDTDYSFDAGLLPSAEAGVLLRGRQRIRARLRVRPRMNLFMRYPSSAQIAGRSNPNLGSRGNSLDSSRQIEEQQKAEADYYKKYMKWRDKEVKAQKRALDKAKKDYERRQLAAKKSRASAVRTERKAKSIQDAPLNPWFSSSKKKPEAGGVLDLQKEKTGDDKGKDPNRRVPLLKQIWRAIFGG